MTLQNGLKVVHKTHGVGEIIGTESMDFGGVSQEFYRLKILSTGMEVKFPVNSSAALIRSLATEAEIETMKSILSEPAKIYSMVWNRRKKELTDKLKTGSILDAAEVVRDLRNKGDGKELSFGEKEVLEKATEKLVNEVSAAMGFTAEKAIELIDATAIEASHD